MRQTIAFFFVFLLLFSIASRGHSQEDPNCAGAPSPQLLIDGYGQVTQGMSNNVRDLATLDGAKVGEIASGEIFMVLEGPVCADGFNWWRVDYYGLIGWTAEGSGTDYFLIPIDGPPSTATPPPPIPAIVYPLSADNALAAGVRARVDIDGLNIRENPGIDAAMLSQAVANEIVDILDGSVEADGFVWWQVEQADGTVGWVVEQFKENDKLYQTLFPICAYNHYRVSFIVHPYIYTSAQDGRFRCVLAKLQTESIYTSWTNLKYMVNDTYWSPQGDMLLYIDSVPLEGDKLYALSLYADRRILLTPNNTVEWAVWSPNGQRIALVMNGQVWVMNRDGTNPIRLTESENRIDYVAWYPDNRNIFYVETIPENPNAVQTFTRTESIFHAIATDMSNPRELFRLDGDIEIRDVELSPDGRYVVAVITEFNEFLEPEGGGAYLYNTETWERSPLEAYWDYLWSPNSQFLVTSLDESLLFNIATGETESIGASVPNSWSQDGQRLYFTDGAGFQVYDIATEETRHFLEAELAYLEPEDGAIDFGLGLRSIREQGTD